MKTEIRLTKSSFSNQKESSMNKMGQSSKFQIGTMLENRYEIKAEIARGGMGIVYEAYDTVVNRQVAIKIILASKIDTLQLKRFQKEIEACARLSHPNVIKIYDAGTYDHSPYIVMEYIDGVNICEYVAQNSEVYGQKNKRSSLRNVDKKGKERDWKLCARLIYETALGLEYIHKQKMFHRDIKPSNILVRANGSPVIIDLGLVKFTQERSYNLTRSRDIVGTCQYMSIEQAHGKRGEIDARSDVYSLGLVLYELLTEQQAYTGKNMSEILNKISSYYPTLPSKINPQIPEILEEITFHAIEKQKEKRYATAQEFADALKQYLDDTEAKASKQYAYYKKRLWLERNKKKIVASCITLLLVCAIIIAMPSKSNSSPKQEKISVQDDAEAQYQLGLMYELGKGVRQDYPKALECFAKAGNQGHAEAQNHLGNFYHTGHLVERNLEKAKYWYEKAATQGNINAQYKLGLLYYNGEEIEEDYEQVLYWWEQAGNQGHAKAQAYLGDMYYNGDEIPQSYKKAKYWYEKAAEQGNAKAQYGLGSLYNNGRGVKTDYKKAKYWYEKAAEQNNAKAQYGLGSLYYNGQGVAKDYNQAILWWEKAGNQGNINAQNKLADMYNNGDGVKQDETKAQYWFQKAFLEYEKAANKGDEEAQLELALIYLYGRGVRRDLEKALYWCEKVLSQDNNDEDAKQMLNQILLLKKTGIF